MAKLKGRNEGKFKCKRPRLPTAVIKNERVKGDRRG